MRLLFGSGPFRLLTVGVYIRVAHILLIRLAVCFLHFFTAAFPPSEKLPEGLVVERIRQVLRHTLKTSETSVRPFRTVANLYSSVFVELVRISGKLGVHAERVVPRCLDTHPHGQIAPRLTLGRHVITQVRSQFVDKADFPYRIVLRTDLHLNVIGDVHRHASGLTPPRHTIEAAAIRRIAHRRHIAVFIRLHVRRIIAITGRTEIRCIIKAYGRREDMADGLYLFTEQRRIKTVKFGRGRYAHIIIIHVLESPDRVVHLTLVFFIPSFHDLMRIHAVGKPEFRRDIDIVEQTERRTDGYVMAHTVTPVLNQVGLEQQVFFRIYAVAQASGVA